jgi:hypothetical protein
MSICVTADGVRNTILVDERKLTFDQKPIVENRGTFAFDAVLEP